MIENRGFDHRLGWFHQTLNPEIDGLNGNETNPIDPSNLSKGYCQVDDLGDPYNTPNAGHGYSATMQEQFGTNYVSDGPPPMNGFIMASDPSWNCRVMESIPVSDIPVSESLLSNFMVIDRWFPSHPGPTEVNRMFYHSATSDGWCENPDDAAYVEGFPQQTIFHRLEMDRKSFRVYMMDDVSTTLFFKDQRRPEALENYHKFDQFLADCANGTLADYSIIEPRYFSLPNLPANDEHPEDHSIYQGELLFKTVYDALRQSSVWNSTALIITYDEHGGLYDHVPSPNGGGIPNPDGQNCTDGTDPLFNFNRLGVRVPAIVISPWVPKGSVTHAPPTAQYDHTSIAKTVHDLFKTSSYLTQRDAWAASLVPLFNLTQVRTDCPLTMPDPKPLSAKHQEKMDNEWQQPLNDWQKSIIKGYAGLNGQFVNPDIFPNQLEGREYVMGQWAKFQEHQRRDLQRKRWEHNHVQQE